MGTYIMCKDAPVLHFDLDQGVYDVLNADLVPFGLKGKIQELPEITSGMSKYELNQYLIAERKNHNAIEHYFAQRVLPLSRENAKKLYGLFNFEQLQDDHSRALIAISCRSLSLQDCYWAKNEGENIPWKDVSLYNNSLSESVAQVALHGASLTIQGIPHTPELNGQGAYAKAWKREPAGLFLYKLSRAENDFESRVEVQVSKLLDKTNVPHVHYFDAESNGRYACKCKLMSNPNKSILPGLDFYTYCNVNNLSFDDEILKIDKTNIYKMWITDYLISNRDRHRMNWGFYFNPNTMKITGCHPLFDHNNSFDNKLMRDKDAPYLFDSRMTMKEAALFAMKHVDLHFMENVSPSDFMDKEQYESFIDRAADLGIKLGNHGFYIPTEKAEMYRLQSEFVQNEIKEVFHPETYEEAPKSDKKEHEKAKGKRNGEYPI